MLSGLIYKNFRINRYSLLFSLITALLCCLTGILMAIFTGGADSIREEDDATSVMLVYIILYYLAFMLPSMTTSLLFEADENKTCCAFAMSCPAGGKGHIHAKYYYLLILNIAILFVTFMSDMIVYGLFGGKVAVNVILVLIFCWRLLLTAIEVPFVVRFGSQRGVAIKGIVIAVVVAVVIIYFLFGDISWLTEGDDPINALIEWFRSGDILFWVSLLPYFSVAAYYISCRISVRLFRKGAENYEQ